MAKCKWCGIDGFFLTVNSDGLCNSCNIIVLGEAQNRLRIINDSGSIIHKSNKPDTIISRTDIAMANLESLVKFEAKGIPILTRPVDDLINELCEISNDKMSEILAKKYEKSRIKAGMAKSEKTKNSTYIKFSDEANKIKTHLFPRGKNVSECMFKIDKWINEFNSDYTIKNVYKV